MKTEQKNEAIKSVQEKAQQDALEFFHDSQRRAYATVPMRGHRETWGIRSRDFRFWVMQTLFDILKSAPPKPLVASCLDEFETHAICRGEKYDVHVRIAEHDGSMFVDLSDYKWRAIKVSGDGWSVVDQPLVKFRRPVGMTNLPDPIGGGKLSDLIGFLNIRPESEVLLLTWLTYALRPNTPYPILALSGVQGAGKSTITRVLRSLIDPSTAPLTTTPRSERDVAIAASNSHLIAMDNMSELSQELSDIMCRVATGGSFRTRELYTNDDEMIFTYRRPLIINGIEELPMRADLLDRSILIHVEPIPEERREDERQFWRRFEEMRPQLFGALLDVLVIGLRNIDGVTLPAAPRMADFARWGLAVERALGFRPGQFLRSYRANILRAHDAAIEASPIASVLRSFLQQRSTFRGPALRLLRNLNHFVSETADTARRHPRWPKSAAALSAEIGRIEPNLGRVGIAVERGRNHRDGRYIKLELTRRDDAGSKDFSQERAR